MTQQAPDNLLTVAEIDCLFAPPREMTALCDAACVAIVGAGVPVPEIRYIAHASMTPEGELRHERRGSEGPELIHLRLGPRSADIMRDWVFIGRPKVTNPDCPELLVTGGGTPLKPSFVVRALSRAFERARVPAEKRAHETLQLSFAALDPPRLLAGAKPRPARQPPMTELPANASAATRRRHRKRERLRDLVAWVKASANGCKDCGGYKKSPDKLTFDHLPGHEKLFDVATATKRSETAVWAEIAKCELVCAACHLKRERARGR